VAVIVPWGASTTSNSRRRKLAGKAGLTLVFAPEPTVGSLPSILLSTMVPWVLQPNLFCEPVGVQLVGWAKHWAMVPQEAEWNFSAIHLPTENAKMTFALFLLRIGATPSFSSRVLSLAPAAPARVAEVLTHGPGAVRPIAPRKNFAVPDPLCGMNALIVAVLPPELPGIWFQWVIEQL